MPMSCPIEITVEEVRLFSRNFILIWFVTFGWYLSYYALMSTLPIYMDRLSMSKSAIGIALSMYFMGIVVVMPFVGRYLDYRGYYGQKVLISSGILVATFCTLAYILSKAITFFIPVRFIHGVGEAVFFTASNAFVISIIPPQRRGEGISYYLISVNLGLVAGPLLGVFLMNSYGVNILFFIMASLSLVTISMAGMISKPEEILGPEKAREANESVINRRALFPSLVIMAGCVSYGVVITFLPLFASSLGVGNYGVLFSIYAVAMISGRLIFGRLSDKYGRETFIIVAMGMAVLAMGLLPFSTSFHMLVGFAIIFGFGFGQIIPLLQAFMIDRIKVQERGSATATYWLGFNLGIIIGSLVLGIVLQASGFTIAFIVAAVITLFGLISFVVGKDRSLIRDYVTL